MKPVDYSLYFVTDPVLCADWGVVETALAAVNGGATIVQVRDHRSNANRLLEDTVEMVKVMRPRGIPVLVNDRIDVALAANADGVHMGPSDIPVAVAREILGPSAVIGLSITAADQITEAERAACDYFSAGPAFDTGTEPDAPTPIGAEGVASIRRAADRPVVAIGGIKTSNVPELAGTGIDGIAVVSAIASASNPRAAAAKLLELFSDARKQN